MRKSKTIPVQKQRDSFQPQHTEKTSEEVKFVIHLNLSFLGLLAFAPQITKASCRVLTIFSCSLFSGSKSSTQVSSWLNRCRRTSFLPVDCVASLEKLSVWSRPMVPKIRLISPMLAQMQQAKISCLLESLSVETVNKSFGCSSVESKQNDEKPSSRFWVFQYWIELLGDCLTCLQVFFV